MNARHIVKLFLNLLYIDLRSNLVLLLIALDPGPQAHLNDRDPYYVAAVIDVSVELVDLVKHSFVVFLGHSHVLLDHLDLLFQSLHMNIIDFIVKLSLFFLFEFDHLTFGHLALDLVDHLHVELALQILLAKHGYYVLEVVLLEPVISGHLQMRYEKLLILRVTRQRYRDEGVIRAVRLCLDLEQELLELSDSYEAGCLRVVVLPYLPHFFDLLFELRDAFFFI
jgi:hypothetical protein